MNKRILIKIWMFSLILWLGGCQFEKSQTVYVVVDQNNQEDLIEFYQTFSKMLITLSPKDRLILDYADGREALLLDVTFVQKATALNEQKLMISKYIKQFINKPSFNDSSFLLSSVDKAIYILNSSGHVNKQLWLFSDLNISESISFSQDTSDIGVEFFRPASSELIEFNNKKSLWIQQLKDSKRELSGESSL